MAPRRTWPGVEAHLEFLSIIIATTCFQGGHPSTIIPIDVATCQQVLASGVTVTSDCGRVCIGDPLPGTLCNTVVELDAALSAAVIVELPAGVCLP